MVKLRKVIYPQVGGVDSIRIVEVDDPVPGPGQVTVRIHRAGINFDFNGKPWLLVDLGGRKAYVWSDLVDTK